MKNVLYVHEGCYDLYTCGSGKDGDQILTKQRYFSDLEKTVKLVSKSPSSIILLEESQFHYYSFKIECTSRDPFSISDLKAIIQEKLQWIRWHDNKKVDYAKHLIGNCKVDKKPTKHVVGYVGTLSFDIHFFLLNIDTYRLFQESLGSTFKKDFSNRIAIVPRMLYLIKHLGSKLLKKDFAILVINKQNCQLMIIRDKFYSSIETINMGESLLQACYNDHNISQYLYEGFDAIESNGLLKKLVEESLSFYAHQLCVWLQQNLIQGYELLVMTDLVENPLFMPILQAHYQEQNNGYIVPLHSAFYDNTYKYKYKPRETPVIAAYMKGFT